MSTLVAIKELQAEHCKLIEGRYYRKFSGNNDRRSRMPADAVDGGKITRGSFRSFSSATYGGVASVPLT
jgi:hypothetical protein